MDGRTQLIIDGVEVVLPQGFATTVKRENSFFTKNGEYTYDCQLSLDNDTNRRLYGFLQRLNKTEAVRTKRPATLMADGKVYCRGTEVITGWTDEQVSVQIVSGNSELNYFIGDTLKIEWLDLGEITSISGITPSSCYPDWDFCLPTLRTQDGNTYNVYSGSSIMAGARTSDALQGMNIRPQPYLCAIVKRLIQALGYTVGVNQLEDTMFKYLFLVNTVRTVKYAEMLSGWRVKDFLTEVENLCGVVFLTDNLHKTVDILQKATYYANATQCPLQNVVDEYELQVEEDGDAEFTSSDVHYDIPDMFWTKLMQLPTGALSAAETADYSSLADLLAATGVEKKILHDTSTNRYYIKVTRTYTGSGSGTFGGSGNTGESSQAEQTDSVYIEIDQMKDIKREDASGTLDLKIVPAPIACLGRHGCEVIDLGSTNGYKGSVQSGGSSQESEEESDNSDDIESNIRNFEKPESSAVDLYCAFHNGTVKTGGCPIAYTDAYHATVQLQLASAFSGSLTGTPVGSLRLADVEAQLYAGVYRVDTSRQIMFETYDPNMADPRAVYVIRNKRYVCREIEETITAKGRKPRWKMTCHPIDISDTAAESRWVLTKGVWDDGGAWLDDGRWLDSL